MIRWNSLRFGNSRMLSIDSCVHWLLPWEKLLAIFSIKLRNLFYNFTLWSGIVEPWNGTVLGPDMCDLTKSGDANANKIPQCHSWTRHFSMNIGVKIGIKIGFWLEMWFFHWRCFRVQFILMVRKYFQPFHLTFNYFWWIAEFNFWPIGFLSGLGLFMIIHVWTTLAVCWYVKHWTVKISNTKTTNLIHWLYESFSGSSFSVKRIRNSQNRVKPNHPLSSHFYR